MLRGDEGRSRGGGRDLIHVVLFEYRSGASLEALGATSEGRPPLHQRNRLSYWTYGYFFTTQNIAHFETPMMVLVTFASHTW